MYRKNVLVKNKPSKHTDKQTRASYMQGHMVLCVLQLRPADWAIMKQILSML